MGFGGGPMAVPEYQCPETKLKLREALKCMCQMAHPGTMGFGGKWSNGTKKHFSKSFLSQVKNLKYLVIKSIGSRGQVSLDIKLEQKNVS